MAETDSELPKSTEKGNNISAGKIFMSAAAGAAGTAVIGLLFSSAALKFLSDLIAGPRMPKGVIVLSRDPDCGEASDGWKPYIPAQGRFVVVAGKTPDGVDFTAGVQRDGRSSVVLSQANLPNIALPLHFGRSDAGGSGPPFVRSFEENSPEIANIPLGGRGEKFEILPSSIALTACERR